MDTNNGGATAAFEFDRLVPACFLLSRSLPCFSFRGASATKHSHKEAPSRRHRRSDSYYEIVIDEYAHSVTYSRF